MAYQPRKLGVRIDILRQPAGSDIREYADLWVKNAYRADSRTGVHTGGTARIAPHR